MLDIGEERIERSCTLLCVLRVGDDALQEISLLFVHCLRDQKATARVAFAHHPRKVLIGVHEAGANLSEQKSNKHEIVIK